jgi:hypothetical protein
VTWDAITAIASVVSMVAYVLTAVYIRAELKGLETDRYLTVTSDLFTTWQSRDFMEAQLWLLHRLEQSTWRDFVAAHRGDAGEIAFHRVGGFYDRVGTLVRLRLVNEKEILSTVGGYAIAVWGKIGPLVREARQIENSTLFVDFERMLPACHECYVPALGDAPVRPFEVPSAPADDRVTPEALRRRIKAGDPPTILDVRNPSQVAADPRRLPGSLMIPVGEVEQRRDELPQGRDIVVLCA